MKKIIIILLIIFNNTLLTADDLDDGLRILPFLNFSYSREFSEKNINNFSIGLDLLNNYVKKINYDFGFNYRFSVRLRNDEVTSENSNIFNIHFLIMPPMDHWLFAPEVHFYTLGLGANISYNFNKDVFGIGPQIDLIELTYLNISSGATLKFNTTYRYNIYINSNNSHEIEFRVGILLY